MYFCLALKTKGIHKGQSQYGNVTVDHLCNEILQLAMIWLCPNQVVRFDKLKRQYSACQFIIWIYIYQRIFNSFSREVQSHIDFRVQYNAHFIDYFADYFFLSQYIFCLSRLIKITITYLYLVCVRLKCLSVFVFIYTILGLSVLYSSVIKVSRILIL